MIQANIRVLLNEFHKRMLILWSYRFNQLVGVATISFFFMGLAYFMGGGEFDRVRLPGMILGYSIWLYASPTISSMTWALREEMETGTLEQMMMSPVPAYIMLPGRILASVVWSTFMISLSLALLLLLLGVSIPVRIEGLPVFIITMIGLLGFGYLIAAAVIVFKQVMAFANMMGTMLLFFNGSLVPIENYPDWLATAARFLPTTEGIVAIREVMLDQQSLGDSWANGSLQNLVIHSSVFLVVGLGCYLWAESIAKKRGSLGQY